MLVYLLTFLWQKWVCTAVFRAFFMVFEVKFTWGKQMIHVEQKISSKKQGKKFGESNK